MITARPTEHLTGIIIEGEYEDFDELVDGIKENYETKQYHYQNNPR